jgi:hypothetical protein
MIDIFEEIIIARRLGPIFINARSGERDLAFCFDGMRFSGMARNIVKQNK